MNFLVGAFASFSVPLFQSEAKCATFHMKDGALEFYLHVNENSFSQERLCTETHFEKGHKTTWK